jgi:hypothetical protein
MNDALLLFLRSGEPVAQRLLDDLVSAVADRYPAARAAPTGDGVGWAACDLTSDRDVAAETRALYPGTADDAERTGPVLVRVTTRPDMVSEAVAAHLAWDGPAELGACDAVVPVALLGYLLDWTIVKTVHAVGAERWSAIAYTDQAGFDVTPPPV